jgi:HAD superfamily hydrolase (TIGR01509 family)
MRNARVAITATFAINGLLYGAWAARIPAISDRLSLGAGELGLALACIAVGSLIAMPAAGWAASRWGSRRATRTALAAFTLASGVVALAPSGIALGALCFFLGASAGSLDVCMNAHGVALERQLERPILSSLHAAFSLGGLAGAASGALAAGAGLDARTHLAALSVLCAVVGLALTTQLLPASADARAADEPRQPLPRAARGRIALLGLLAFCCLLAEGAAADWSAVYADRSLAASAGVAALAYAAFSLTMALGRLGGDAITTRVGAVRLVRAGGLLAAAGLGGALLIAAPAAAIVGFACLGAGLACVIPTVFRAAGNVPGTRSAAAIAAVSTTGYLGFLAGPPLIGGLAELTSLPAALAVLPLLAALVAVLARAVRPEAADGPVLLSDLDGVLVDSGDAVERAWRNWAAAHDLDFARVERAIHGRPSREAVAELLPGGDAAAESGRIESLQVDDLAGVGAVPGARELLERWPAERLAIVTSATVPLATARLRHAGLPVPATLVTEERVSNGKPAPEGYLTAARELGVTPQDCVVLEDAPAGVQAGLAAGMRVIGVLTTHRRDELPGAAAYVDDLRDVWRVLGER